MLSSKSDYEHAMEHLKGFYTSDRITSDKIRVGGMFKKFASIVINRHPEFYKEDKFIQEIKRIKGALK